MQAHRHGLVISEGDPLGSEATFLLRCAFDEALQRYGDVLDPSKPPSNEFLVDTGLFLIARVGDDPIGCIGPRPLGQGVGEVRRMFVARWARRQGVGKRLLSTLEQKAGACGYFTVRLETGRRQPEAVAFSESNGYRRIPPFGSHVEDPTSICFEKELPRP